MILARNRASSAKRRTSHVSERSVNRFARAFAVAQTATVLRVMDEGGR
jgi:hypothetical protein